MFGMFGVLTTVLTVTTLTSGYKYLQGFIPNGHNVSHPCKPNKLWPGVGHINSYGSGQTNVFGNDFNANGKTWTTALCQMDSDGDGLTNGQELGDPGCVWIPGAVPTRTSNITHPGVCNNWDDSACASANSWVDCEPDTGFTCAALERPDVKNVTIRFPRTPVPPTETNYMCMTFDLPGDDVYHLIGTKPAIDNTDVMHHILIYGCHTENPPTIAEPTPCGMSSNSGCSSLIGLWSFGHDGSCIPNKVGFRFGKGVFTRIKMESHWNNPQLKSNYTDASGMTLFYTNNLRPNDAETLTLGQIDINIPPRQPKVIVESTCTTSCSHKMFKEPIYIIEAVNHMHYLGRRQTVEVIRNGVSVATLTNDTAYSYDLPVFHTHDPPIQIQAGDQLRTICEYDSSDRANVTKYGEDTSAEMCYAFLTVYPKSALTGDNCINQGETSFCSPSEANNPGAGCDFEVIFNMTDPAVLAYLTQLFTHCLPFGPCTDNCRALLAQQPCLRLDKMVYVKEFMMQDKNGLHLLSLIDGCRPVPECSACPECAPSTTSSNSNGASSGDTGASPALLPELISVVTLLVLAVLAKN